MIRLGTTLAFFGFGSVLLYLISMHFVLLMWADPMQPVFGLVVGSVGAAIILIKMLVSKDSAEGPAPAGAPGQFGPPPGAAPSGVPGPQSYGLPAGPQQYGQPAGPQQYGQAPSPQQYGPPQGFAPQGYPPPANGMPPATFGPQGGPDFGPRG